MGFCRDCEHLKIEQRQVQKPAPQRGNGIIRTTDLLMRTGIKTIWNCVLDEHVTDYVTGKKRLLGILEKNGNGQCKSFKKAPNEQESTS